MSEPRKGVAILLDALAILLRTTPDMRLWLSGPGDAAALLDHAPASVREHVDVLPLGDPMLQAERYGRAWVMTLPSRGDSFGMVVVEALACGTPVAVSGDAALPELVTAGETGAVCDAGSAESVAEAISTCLELASKPGTAAACRASAEPFDWKTGIAPAFEKLYAAG